jgi:hypothetical protein
MTITISTPSSSATVSGTVALTGTDSGVTVTAKAGSLTVGSQTLATQAFSFGVDTTVLANGNNTLSVSDPNGSASVVVNVQNTVAVKQLVLSAGTSVTRPADWSDVNQIECWGAGGGGGAGGGLGGGSGGYSSKSNVPGLPSTFSYSVGAAGVGAPFNAGHTPGTDGGVTFFGSNVFANGGKGGNDTNPGAGGSTTGALGDVLRAGTTGGTNANDPGAGGAGAPGPNGLGSTGGIETATVGGPGGSGNFGAGGAGGSGGTAAAAPGNGADNSNGGGGGGGSAGTGNGGAGGTPGGGGGGHKYGATSGKGGDGGKGQIRLTWTPGGGIVVPPPAGKVFWGVNGHWDYPESTATIIAALKYMGYTVYRMAWEGDQQSLNSIVNMANAFKNDGTGLQLYVCLDVDTHDDTGTWYTSDSLAYSKNFTYGQQVATALAPYAANVMCYEIGNEMARKNGMVLNPAIMGTDPSDFNQTRWHLMNQVCAGATDGVRSVSPSIPVANNALTFAEFAVTDMLWNGTQPNGGTGLPQVRWDLTSLHSYKSWGDPVNISMDGNGTVRFDLYAKLTTNHGKPLVISEWGADATGPMSDSQQNAWNNTVAGEMYARRESLGGPVKIRCNIMYELYNTDYPWGVIVNGASTQTTALGANMKAFIAAHPDI